NGECPRKTNPRQSHRLSSCRMRAWRYTMKTLRIRSQLTAADPLQAERLLKALRIILEHQEAPDASSLLTNGVSRLQTNQYNSTCWPYCHGPALPPHWLKACNPARNGGVYDHSGFDQGVVL